MLKATQTLLRTTNAFIPNTKVVYETINQHKYSRIANASYYFKNQAKVKKSFNEMPELSGFVLDKLLSNHEASVFVNEYSKEVVVCYRGTSSLKDVGTDLMVLTSTTNLSYRVRSSLKLMERVLRRYTRYKVVTTGHSLGGMLSRIVGNTFHLENHNFNPAESVHGMFQRQNEMTFNYRTSYDSVSVLSKNTERVMTRIGNEKNILSVHQLDNFYDKNSKRVIRDGEEMFESNKSTKVYEHSVYLGTAIDIVVAGYDIKTGINKKQRPLEIADNVTKDITPFNPVQLVIDSEDGREIDRVIRYLVDEQSFSHHDKSFMEMLFEDAERYNQQKTTDIPYEYLSHTVDVSNYHQVMGQGFISEIDRVNPHLQNRFKPE